MTRFTYSAVCLACLVFTLSACGGGGGGGGSDTPTTPQQTQSFTVSLDSVDVRRSSGSGEAVTVDTSAVTTGSLTYQ